MPRQNCGFRAGLDHGDAVDAMRRTKRAFDPNGTLNPGKVLPAE